MSDTKGQQEVDQHRVRFKGQEYLLIGDPFGGFALATRDQFENFEPSFAHVFDDGKIRQFGVVIGDKSELEEVPNV